MRIPTLLSGTTLLAVIIGGGGGYDKSPKLLGRDNSLETAECAMADASPEARWLPERPNGGNDLVRVWG